MPLVLIGVAAFSNCTKLIKSRHFCFIKQHQSIALVLDCTLQIFTVKIHARDYYDKFIFVVPMYYVKSVLFMLLSTIPLNMAILLHKTALSSKLWS